MFQMCLLSCFLLPPMWLPLPWPWPLHLYLYLLYPPTLYILLSPNWPPYPWLTCMSHWIYYPFFPDEDHWPKPPPLFYLRVCALHIHSWQVVWRIHDCCQDMEPSFTSSFLPSIVSPLPKPSPNQTRRCPYCWCRARSHRRGWPPRSW